MGRPRPSLPLPTWATDATHSAPGKPWDGLSTRIDPGVGKRATGYQPEDRPPAEFLNHKFGLLGDWVEHLSNIQAQNFTPVGVSGNGGAALAYASQSAVWAMVSGTDQIDTSPDGYTWTSRTPGTPQGLALEAAAASGALIIALGDGNDYYHSADGVTWNGGSLPGGSTIRIFGAVWDNSNGMFVVVGRENVAPFDARIYTSSVGTGGWTSQTVPSGSGVTLNMVAVSDSGRLVAYARGSGNLYTSDDGITWTLRTSPGADARGLAWSSQEQRFMMVFGNTDVKTSSDGVTWTTISTGSLGGFVGGSTSEGRNCLANHGSLWIAAGQIGSTNYVKYSTDNGVTWSRYPMPGAFEGRAVVHGDNRFIVSGQDTLSVGLIRLGADSP